MVKVLKPLDFETYYWETVSNPSIKNRPAITLENEQMTSLVGPNWANEIQFAFMELDRSDLQSIWLYHEFKNETSDGSNRLASVDRHRASNELLKRSPHPGHFALDLRTKVGLEPTIVGTPDLRSPWSVIDGNHRLMSHFITTGCVEGVRVYAAMHPQLVNWDWYRFSVR